MWIVHIPFSSEVKSKRKDTKFHAEAADLVTEGYFGVVK